MKEGREGGREVGERERGTEGRREGRITVAENRVGFLTSSQLLSAI